ncbi:MAG: CHAP domain-containing protein, partial [Atopobiaceae bacterium]|nr:CHAP domain-containing protein [Atopobiaceae bacterium]
AVVVRAHCSDAGWLGWVGSGQVAGTVGECRQVECVQINLSGYAVSFFDIYYRVHIEDYGWLGWAKNGEMAGSTNGRKRMEAIQIRLVVKGEAFDTGGAPYMELTQQVKSARDEAVEYLNSLVGQNCCWNDNTTDCVDVAQYYYDWLGVGARSGNGCNYHTGNLPAGWTRIYSDPLPGDVAAWGSSWGSSGYGHVACVVDVSGDTITVVEQSTTKRKKAGHNVPCYYKTYSIDSPYSYLRPNF